MVHDDAQVRCRADNPSMTQSMSVARMVKPTPRLTTFVTAIVLVTTVASGLLMTVAAGQSSDVRVLSSNGLRAVLQALVPTFEARSGYHVRLVFGPAAALAPQIARGEAFDVAVLTPGAIDDAIASGWIAPSSRVVIAQSPLGLAMRAGATPPPIDTVDALTRTLRAARSIAIATQGASAQPFEAIIADLQLSDIRARYVLRETGAHVAAAVADGSAEFGVLPVSEILPAPGVALAGVFPPTVQQPLLMVGGVATRAGEPGGAAALLRYLQAADHSAVFRQFGMARP